ncbi:MAG: radical SAM protein [Nitrospirae bacterium]|nr:radical SAM protein [Nitrospirota bacterium]
MPISEAHDFFIQWHLTERCNLRCTHCYQTGVQNNELSLDEVLSVIDEVDDTIKAWADNYSMDFSPSFNVTGGEPFLRTDLFDILSAMRGRGFNIYLLTNGTMIDRNRARKLSDLGVNGIQISIEGPEHIHDAIRGKGSFARSKEGVRHLVDHGHTVTLNATLSEVNADSFTDVIDIACAMGVQRLGFSRLVPSGRGKQMINQSLSTDRVKHLYEKIFSLQPAGLEIVTGDPVASQMACVPDDADTAAAVASGGCAAGISGLTFLADGTITPCRRLPVPIGNIRTDSLREVWATSEILEMLRDRTRYGNRCGSCKRWSTCRGCRAIAYARSQAEGEGDILADDPQCFIGD